MSFLVFPNINFADAEDPQISVDLTRKNTLKLDKLQEEIELLRQELKNAKTKKQDLQNQLQLLDRQIGKSNDYVRELGKQIEQHKHKLNQLAEQTKKHQQLLIKQQGALARQIRSAYILGSQDFLKMLFNQQETATLSRTLTYYDYINKARSQRINEANNHIDKLNAIAQSTLAQTDALEKNRELRAKERKSLTDTYQSRHIVLARLTTQIDNKTKQQHQIEENISNLSKLLNNLKQHASRESALVKSRIKFSSLKGRMEWPSEGKLKFRYGTSRQLGKLKWQGIVIESAPGNEVRAVSHGQVVYADWLRGFGLLLIIDHGDGYMSLYGQNESLHKNRGDVVGENELIARAGSSGGANFSGLYFEIRRQGKPIDPLKWLLRKN